MREYLVKRVSGAPDWESIPAMQVDNVMWTPDFGISMTARLAYDETAIYVHQRAVEKNIRAELTDLLAHVCEDSCMEFFLSPCPADGRYLNFEVNPN
ncbi:MAG: carbohydrate-binding family 9-like protein, partial [Oscillibacter sp.]|nr:carbohydrate-binding family 9-like protein [Oscillibacter sp.]